MLSEHVATLNPSEVPTIFRSATKARNAARVTFATGCYTLYLGEIEVLRNANAVVGECVEVITRPLVRCLLVFDG